jgi:hypothetical protein
MGGHLHLVGTPVNAETSHMASPRSNSQSEHTRIDRVPHWACSFAGHEPPRLQVPPPVPSIYVSRYRRGHRANAPTRPREQALLYAPGNTGNMPVSVPPREASLAYRPPNPEAGYIPPLA